MLELVRRTAHWVGRHSLPAAAATVVVVAAAGSGIGYTVAAQHTAAATTSATPASGSASPPSTTHKLGEALTARLVKRLARAIDVPVATVRTELTTRSINDVIAAAGKNPATIEADIMAQLKVRGDRAVAAGRVTAQQEAAWLAAARPEVDKLMADAPAQRAADVRALLQALRAHHPKVTTPAP